MITEFQKKSLIDAYNAAKEAKHIFPEIAACEAMEESTWGSSKLFYLYCNAFGMKQKKVPIFKTINLPTWEVVKGKKIVINADFVWFPSLAEAFSDRMRTLLNNPTIYGTAIGATTPQEYIQNVCGYRDKNGEYHSRWATDPNRASIVLAIYSAHKDLLK